MELVCAFSERSENTDATKDIDLLSQKSFASSAVYRLAIIHSNTSSVLSSLCVRARVRKKKIPASCRHHGDIWYL